MNLKSYNTQSTVTDDVPDSVLLLTGAFNGTIVRSLEITNPTDEQVVVSISRQDAEIIPGTYGAFTLTLEPSDYVLLWVGCQVVVPFGHTLLVSAAVAGIRFVANTVEV